MKLHWLVVLLSFLYVLPISASPIDSLLQVLYNTSEPASKVNILIELAHESVYDNHDKQLEYAMRAYELFNQSNIENDSLHAEVLFTLGDAHEINEQEEVALQLFNQSQIIAKRLSIKQLLYSIFNSKGLLYGKLGTFDLAIENYQKSLSMAEASGDTEGVSIASNNIALIYTDLKEFDKAKKLLKKSYDLSQVVGDTHGQAIALANTADIYFQQKDWDAAADNYQQALNIVDSMDIAYGIAHANLHLGLTYQKKGILEIAKKHCQKAYDISKKQGFQSKIGAAALGLAQIKLAEGDYQNSIAKAAEALEFAHQFKSKSQLSKVFKCLSENYEAMGDFEKALTYRQQYEIQRDSFFDEEKIAKFATLEYQFNTQKKEAENTLLKARMIKNKATLQQQTMITWGIGILVVLLTGLIWGLLHQNKLKQRYNQKLEQQVAERTQHLQQSNEKLSRANQELEQFAYITSHDLKEPLRNISGFSSLVKRNINQKKYENVEEYLDFIHQNTRQMHTLIEDILSYSKVGNSSEVHKTTSLALILENTKNDLHLLLTEKNGEITYLTPDLHNQSANILLPFQVSMIFKNLIENGLKYNKSRKPIIKIGYGIKEDAHIFTIQDNGIGIEKVYHEKVFEMFKRLHHRGEYTGSGVGLAICRKVVQNLKGGLTIAKSDIGGTTFELRIPIGQAKLSADSLAQNAEMSAI